MMQSSFGAYLREAREKRGISLDEAARQLCIRPDIIRSIENSDLSNMPPKGYARNMISSYARLVGLNPDDLTKMYLDDQYAFQVGRVRGANEATRNSFRQSYGRSSDWQRMENRGYSMNDDSLRIGDYETQMGSRPRPPQTKGAPSRAGAPYGARGGRNMSRITVQDDTRYRRDRNGDFSYDPQRTGGGRTPQAHTFDSGSFRPNNRSMSPNSHYTSIYADETILGRLRSTPLLLIGIAVIVVILVLVLVFSFGSNKSKKAEETAQVPVTGLTDTTEQQAQPQAPVETAPTSVEVVYEVSDGNEAYVIITEGDSSNEKILTGPVKETVEVSGKWSIASWASDYMKVTVGGEEKSFDSTNDDGMPLCEVNFEDYLAKWKADHKAASSASSSASTANATSSASTSANASNTASSSTTGN